jgi:crotonobetainyl-CoA:carnitine CoA-transferase CaiB-like acyl-CoA transferase
MVLAGVRVVEVSQMAFVPSAGAILAEWGAEVIKIEHPAHGDRMRWSIINGVMYGTYGDGFTMMWENANRGKRSVGLDLGTKAGLETLLELVDGADVFLTNFLPDARVKLGIDESHIHERNPRIIYARGSGYGPKGPLAGQGGYDLVAFWHRTGISYETTPRESEHPLHMPGPGFGDYISGLAMAGGVAAALYQRDRTGVGTTVDVSLLGSGLWCLQANLVAANSLGRDSFQTPRREEIANPLTVTYRTADDRHITLCMLQADKLWPGFCRAIEREDLLDDPKLKDMATRAQDPVYCVEILDKVFAERTLAEWRDVLARQEGPWDVVKMPGEVFEDEQVAANGYVSDVDYGAGRHIRLVTSPVQFDERAADLRPAPEIGAQTEEVLLELGKTWDDISALRDAQAIR